jgi:hypothetical protein
MPESARLLALGDISLSGLTRTQFEQSTGYKVLAQKLNAYGGITLANLECALTTSKNLNQNKIALRADPRLLGELPRIDVFSLANNHIYDAWAEGANDTMEALSQHGKTYFGYGKDLLGARKPALIEKGGIRLGLLGYSCLSTNGQNYATTVKPGVSPLAVDYLGTDIAQLKNKVDHIIVVLHWGEEQVHYPTPDQIAVAHRAIDLGASAIVGIHPHAIQGVERYKDGFICYSLGNFIFAEAEIDQLREGKRVRYTLKLPNISKESIGVEFALEKNKICLNSVKAFKLDRYFLPNEVPLDRLHTNLSKLNAELEAYVKKNSDYLHKIDGPQLVRRISNHQCGTYYVLKPINGSQASFRSSSIKLLTFKALRKAQSYVTRPFLGGRGN